MNRVSNTRLLAGVLLFTGFLFACTTPPQTKMLLAKSSADLPVNVELKETPFYPQKRYQCGPAALATVLGIHSVDVTPGELVDAVFVPSLKGSLPEEITATARRYGMLAYPLQPSLTDLIREVSQGNPVLVFQNLGTRWFPKWHFAVVIGYDLTSHEVILRSGTTKRWLTTLATFERTWSRTGYWALVILPAGSMPASAQPKRYLQAAYDLEASGRSDAALLAYRVANNRWPDDVNTWMALGNSLYTFADYAQAEAAFRKVTRLAAEDPKGWNNLAYALIRNFCPCQARHAASCALRLAPTESNYLDTLKEIDALAHGSDGAHCLPTQCNQ
ncbi:MAG: PA2778 family cysteine peptidase [Pseudomonadota bacterium]